MLKENFYLCYINNEKLFAWIKENQWPGKNSAIEKQKWEKETNREPNFFSDTKLLLVWRDILLLIVTDNKVAFFLAQTYQLNYQATCQKIFAEKKNIILVSQEQWNSKDTLQKSIILWKDEESSKKALTNWLEKLFC